MKRIMILTVAGALSALLGDKPTNVQSPHLSLTLHIPVCEAGRMQYWFNEDVKRHAHEYITPMEKVPVTMRIKNTRVGQVLTDASGKAALGPFDIAPNDPVSIHVGPPAPYQCVTIGDFVGRRNGYLKVGDNVMLYVTAPL